VTGAILFGRFQIPAHPTAALPAGRGKKGWMSASSYLMLRRGGKGNKVMTWDRLKHSLLVGEVVVESRVKKRRSYFLYSASAAKKEEGERSSGQHSRGGELLTTLYSLSSP